jgi:hypothetical protein
MEEPSGYVFISYMREDSDRVGLLQRALEAAGVRVWRDKDDLWPGDDWRIKIRNAITGDALVFIACFSSRGAARAKSYQNEEMTLAVEQVRLRRSDVAWPIPVRFDDCQVPEVDLGGGRSLRDIHRADLFGDCREAETSRLVATVRRLLGQQSEEERVANAKQAEVLRRQEGKQGAREAVQPQLDPMHPLGVSISAGSMRNHGTIVASGPGSFVDIVAAGDVVNTGTVNADQAGPGVRLADHSRSVAESITGHAALWEQRAADSRHGAAFAAEYVKFGFGRQAGELFDSAVRAGLTTPMARAEFQRAAAPGIARHVASELVRWADELDGRRPAEG